MNLTSGTMLGPYRVLDKLGEGGMGEVFAAQDTRLDRRVAIKGLPAPLLGDPIARERLRREALATAALDDPFICKVFELLDDPEGLFIVMEFVDGETLHQRLSAGPLRLAEGLRIAAEIAEALGTAHARELVHRDLKPSNVMLTRQGRTKVMDFGLARQTAGARETMAGAATQAPLTDQGMRVGTPDYMSPEQALGDDPDPRSDLFAFGILLCEMLAGVHPFRRATSGSTLSAIVREEPMFAAAAALPPAVQLILRRLLAKSPSERYQTIADVRRDLAAVTTSSAVAPAVEATGRGNSRFPLVGRASERAELLRGLDAALSGQGSIAMISGEPGIGKTRLTLEILMEARRRGGFCLVGHCYEMEGAPPYVPFVEMLEYSARSVPPATFRQALGDAASAVSKLMPELRRIFPDVAPPPELPPEQQRRYLFNAYLEFVERSCRATPLAVVLEDLHWADEPTLMLLQHVAQAAASLPLFIMATYRDVELGVTRPFARTLETLLRERRATRLALRRLPREAVQTMLESMSGHPPPPSFARVIFEETEGNPFFVEEVFQHLAEEGRLFDGDGQWRQDLQVRSLEVPESVRLVIGRRLERLGADARSTLATAAVIGRTFSLQLLESLHASPDAALDAIEEAERAQLVVAEPRGREMRYRFAHELIRQTLAETLSMPRRQRQHARIAEAIERLYAPGLDRHVLALAHHLYQAGTAAAPEKAATYLRQAAAQARAACGFEEALAHLDNALSLWEGEETSVVASLIAERATVCRSLGRRAEAIAGYKRAVDICDRLGNRAEAATVALDLVIAQVWEADNRAAFQTAQQNLLRAGAEHDALHCRVLLSNALALAGLGRPGEALDAYAEARRVACGIADPRLAVEMRLAEIHIQWSAMHVARATELARELGAGAEAAGNDYLWAEVKWIEGSTYLYTGEFEKAGHLFNAILPRAERAGHHNVVWICQSFLSVLRLQAGDLRGARTEVLKARAIGEQHGVVWKFFDDHALGLIALFEGDSETAGRHLVRALDEQPLTYWRGITESHMAFLRAWHGDTGALEMLDRIPAWPVPGGVVPAGAWFALPLAVRALALLGRTEEVARLVPAAQALMESGLIAHYYSSQTTAGIAAAAARSWAASEDQHRQAIEHVDRLPFPIAQPDTREWYARMLMERDDPGDADRARELLVEAGAQYDAMGMVAFAARAAKLRAAISGVRSGLSRGRT